MFALTQCDFYKTGHYAQYPQGTELVYSNFTPRSAKLFNSEGFHFNNKIVMFGLQYFINDYLIEEWNNTFFSLPKEAVVSKYKRRMDTALGPNAVSMSHIEALHDLGYLPLEIRAISEGSEVNIGIPVLTVHNTVPEAYWLVNYIETVMSAELWKPMTTATIARQYFKILSKYAELTGAPQEFVSWQGHDFSFRGMSGRHDAAVSGMGHLLSFTGTDTVTAIDALEHYYGADSEKELIGGSVPATEHSVMCAGGEKDEIETFRRLIEDVYPVGIVSIVSDTWDFWQVITEYTKTLKEKILSREGKVVFRPDSGDPVKILCGDPESQDQFVRKGAVECLWDIFGGTYTEKGYKVLDSHVGLIYGDSITLQRAAQIMNQLHTKGFASCNVVFGIGSYTYQYITRDTFGFAMKATYVEVEGEGKAIQKNPKTDSGTKKSASGKLCVNQTAEGFTLEQDVEDISKGCLDIVFKDGKLLKTQTLSEIRSRLVSQD